jgi:23S rRNA (cytidine2498-2'-O)-methyltransferase
VEDIRSMTDEPRDSPTPLSWLVRVPRVFAGLTTELFKELTIPSGKKLGQEYHLIKIASRGSLGGIAAELMIPWNLPVQHAWPCDPQQTQGFVEKAARALAQKFSGAGTQMILVGALDPDPSQRYFRALASNLRGRVLQLFPGMATGKQVAESQDPAAPTLFCLVGREGLYAGVQSPRACGGFHPGGTKFVKQDAPGAISRAGAKVAEALHHLRLYRAPLPDGSHWLELGASPGGMTSELLKRGFRVTAVDRAPLDARLRGVKGLSFVKQDAAELRVREGTVYDAILCDLNGEASESMRHVARLAPHLRKGGIVIFTLKLPRAETVRQMMAETAGATSIALGAGLIRVAVTHLSYNRREFTMFFEKQ